MERVITHVIAHTCHKIVRDSRARRTEQRAQLRHPGGGAVERRARRLAVGDRDDRLDGIVWRVVGDIELIRERIRERDLLRTPGCLALGRKAFRLEDMPRVTERDREILRRVLYILREAERAGVAPQLTPAVALQAGLVSLNALESRLLRALGRRT